MTNIPYDRAHKALHSNTLSEQLAFASDRSFNVRKFLCRNNSLCEEVALKLSADKDYRIRIELCKNNSLSNNIYAILAKDSEKEVLIELLLQTSQRTIIEQLKNHPNTMVSNLAKAKMTS